MTLRKLVVMAGASVWLLSAASAPAANHLACYKVKDSLPKARFENVSLPSDTGLPTKTPCTIYGGAKLCCDVVDKIGVAPQPGGGGPTTPTSKFCCYKVKCPKGADLAIPEKDQFGSRTVAARKAMVKYVCAPSSPSGAFLDDASGF